MKKTVLKSFLVIVVIICLNFSFTIYADENKQVVTCEYTDNGDRLVTDDFISETMSKGNLETRSFTISGLFGAYPTGSFYTKNGRSCTCHGTTNCPENCNCMAYYAYDDSGVDSVCYQCAAFAKLCYKTFNGDDVPYHPDYMAPNLVTLTESNLYSYLQAMGTYSYVRGITQTGYPHSVFVISYSQNDVTIYHANYDKNNTGAKCNVLNETVSYSEFIKRISKLRFYYTSGGNYVSF